MPRVSGSAFGGIVFHPSLQQFTLQHSTLHRPHRELVKFYRMQKAVWQPKAARCAMKPWNQSWGCCSRPTIICSLSEDVWVSHHFSRKTLQSLQLRAPGTLDFHSSDTEFTGIWPNMHCFSQSTHLYACSRLSDYTFFIYLSLRVHNCSWIPATLWMSFFVSCLEQILQFKYLQKYSRQEHHDFPKQAAVCIHTAQSHTQFQRYLH